MKSAVVSVLVEVINLKIVEISPLAWANAISCLMRSASCSGDSSAALSLPTDALRFLSLPKAELIFLPSVRNKALGACPTSKAS